MQIITPNVSEIQEIQDQETTFYFSGSFDAILSKRSIICSDDGPFGPGIVTHRFSRLESLEANRPHVFEGPFSPELVQNVNLDVELLEASEIELIDADGRKFSNFCYQTTQVRWIPPIGSKEQPRIEPYKPKDSRWNPQSFTFHAFRTYRGAQPILQCELPGGRRVTIGIQVDSRIYLGIPLLGVIVQHLVAPPYHGASFNLPVRYCSTYQLEDWFFQQVNRLTAETGWPYACTSPWPAGYKAALCIRHDFDRPVKRESVEHLLRVYKKCHEIKSTWFWRVTEADCDIINLVKRGGHEVALHTEKEGREGFLGEHQFFASECGLELKGYSAHGGRGSCGYLGQRQFDWALDADMEYGELLVSDSGLPYPSVVVHDDVPALTNLWLPGTHYSIDRGTKPEAYDLDSAQEYFERRLRRGEQIVIMNHPDIHREPLIEFVTHISRSYPSLLWHATLLESVRWCRQRNNLRASYTDGHDVSLQNTSGLDHDVEVWLEGIEPHRKEIRQRLAADFERVVLSTTQTRT